MSKSIKNFSLISGSIWIIKLNFSLYLTIFEKSSAILESLFINHRSSAISFAKSEFSFIWISIIIIIYTFALNGSINKFSFILQFSINSIKFTNSIPKSVSHLSNKFLSSFIIKSCIPQNGSILKSCFNLNLTFWPINNTFTMTFSVLPITNILSTIFGIRSTLSMCFAFNILSFINFISICIVIYSIAMFLAILKLTFIPSSISQIQYASTIRHIFQKIAI